MNAPGQTYGDVIYVAPGNPDEGLDVLWIDGPGEGPDHRPHIVKAGRRVLLSPAFLTGIGEGRHLGIIRTSIDTFEIRGQARTVTYRFYSERGRLLGERIADFQDP